MKDPVGHWAGEGEKDSSGQFTLDWEAARRKLAELSRCEPDLMLGKLVQAAVAGRAREIRFQVGRQSVQARILFPDQPPSSQARAHLTSAMALASYLQPRKLAWTCAGVERCLPDQGGPLELSGPCLFTFQYQTWAALKALLTGRSNQHLLLHQRAYLCPIPVYLDSLLVNRVDGRLPAAACEALHVLSQPTGLLAPSLTQFQATSVHLGQEHAAGWNSFGQGTSLQRLLIVEGAPEARVQSRDLERRPTPLPWQPAEGEEVVLCSSCDPKGKFGWTVNEQWEWTNPEAYLSRQTSRPREPRNTLVNRWVSFTHSAGPCELWPILDGLLLDKIPLDGGPAGCRVIEAVHGVNVDLDQIRLVRDERFERLKPELLHHLQHLRSQWKRGRPSF